MTDLQRHLKGIQKILRQFVGKTNPHAQVDLQALKQALTAFLPHSYGLGSGQIVGEYSESQPVQLLLYDRPLSGDCYTDDADRFRIEHVLCILDVAVEHTPQTLGIVINRIASFKRLQTFRVRETLLQTSETTGQVRRSIPKDRLPFALITFDRFEPDHHTADPLPAHMDALLRSYPSEHWPDQIDVLGQQFQYRHPLLSMDKTAHYAMGWCRLPDAPQPFVCYVCKTHTRQRHFFYDQLCPQCGDLNYQKRVQTADLSGYRILVTGARVKIGYITALMLLRAGADVIVTSRFPRDTARRYEGEADFSSWCGRLHVYGLDLRQIPTIETFVAQFETAYPYLDAVINNAAQTVKRPAAYYAHLLPLEQAPFDSLPESSRRLLENGSAPAEYLPHAINSLLPTADDPSFPAGQFDDHGQQVDNRDFNSWVMRLEDISPLEMVEVQLVNAVAPALLAGQLKPMLLRSPHQARFILNVSAAEGRFSQYKTGYHPHTNMAKAALNMLTRTIAEPYASEHIYVNSIDPGWVSDQLPRTDQHFRDQIEQLLPIDLIDAAARVCDPLFTFRKTGQVTTGRLLKDYRQVNW
jgi:NAD(P)-dependent dehydrogenase (short-subunit alcohol dehydrogenase family)